MKIINTGVWKEVWSHKALCRNQLCLAELLIEEEDVVATGFSNYLHNFEYTCPVCKNVNPLDRELIREEIRHALVRKLPIDNSLGRD